VSVAIRSSIESLINIKKLTSAVSKALLGDVDDFIDIVMTFAANNYFITGNGLADIIESNPKLLSQEEVCAIQKEILARFPEPIQTAIAERQLRDFDLEKTADRVQWLKILISIDLLRDFIELLDVGKTSALKTDASRPDETSDISKKFFLRGISDSTIKQYLLDEINEPFSTTSKTDADTVSIRRKVLSEYFAKIGIDGMIQLAKSSLPKESKITISMEHKKCFIATYPDGSKRSFLLHDAGGFYGT